ncbi:TPA: hypothetical protein ACN33D_003771 [Vibrio parahaemolyticus]
MRLEDSLQDHVFDSISRSLGLTINEKQHLQFAVNWNTNELMLSSYMAANALNGTSTFDCQLPIVSIDEDGDITSLELPHEIDWSKPKQQSLLSMIEMHGIRLDKSEPSENFKTWLRVAQLNELHSVIKRSVEHHRRSNSPNAHQIPLLLDRTDYLFEPSSGLAVPNTQSMLSNRVENQIINQTTYKHNLIPDNEIVVNPALDISIGVER